MTRRISVVLSLVAAVLAVSAVMWVARAETPAAAPPVPELKVLKSIPGGGEGGWDYVTADQEGKRAYVSRGTHFMVFDVEQGKVVGDIPDTAGAHGVALVPALGLGFATAAKDFAAGGNGKEGTVHVFDTKTLKTLRKIKAGEKPDALCFDPASQRVFVFNGGSGDVTVIDPAALDKAPEKIAIGGKLEAGVPDGAGHLYVNVEDKSEVAVIDIKQMKVTAHWPVAPGQEPTGLAMDVAHRRLFSVCGNQKMVVLDADSGKVLADLPIGPGCDGAAFDPKLGVAVSSNGGDGTMTVVREEPAGTFKVVQTVKTAKGARTIAVDLKTHCFYTLCNLPGAESGKTEFNLMVVGAAAK
jgi:DNA-binding beta-propeller fold protein YncE